MFITDNEVAVYLYETAQVVTLHLCQADVVDHQSAVIACGIQVVDINYFLYGFAVEDVFRGARLLVGFIVELGVDGFTVLHFLLP